MHALHNYYLCLTIRTRIVLLCSCYSFCMIASTILGDSDSPVMRYGSLVLFITLGAIFGSINVIGIGTSIKRVLNHLETMAQGDFSQPIIVRRNNEISEILRALISVQMSLRTIIAGIKSTSVTLNTAVDDLRKTSENMTQDAEQAEWQSTSVVTATEQLSTVISDIAQNCQVMADKALETKTTTIEGERTIEGMARMIETIGQMVTDTTRAVESLGANSSRIGEITATIEDIADQTNLLALNAAIEAARAGEQGRGFAVVADEVRVLAGRTTKATSQINKIISTLQNDVNKVMNSMKQSSESVDTGVHGVRGAKKAIADVRIHIEVLTDGVTQVATAVEEQSATTASVVGNIHAIKDVITKVTRGIRENDLATTTLAGSVGELKNMSAKFRV